MELRLKIDTGGDPYEVVTTFATVIAWERKTKKTATDAAKGIGYDDLAYLAYVASKKAGVVVPAVYDDFVDKIVSIEVVETEPTNPTREEHGPTA
jgi:hypothetical protein